MQPNSKRRAPFASRVLTILGLFLAPGAIGQVTPDSMLIRVGRVLPVTSDAIEGGAIRIEGGRITAVGKEVAAPAGARTLSFPNGVACPGLIDAGSFLGLYRERNESAGAILPDLRVLDGFDPFHADIAKAARSGITTVQLLPGDELVLGGRAAIVSLHKGGRARTVRPAGAYKASLRRASWPRQRPPTSAVGGRDMLRGAVRKSAPLAAGLDTAGMLVRCDTPLEIALARDLSAALGKKGVLVTGPEVRGVADTLTGKVRGVIFEPLLPSRSDLDRAAPAAVKKAEVPIAFSTRGPEQPASALRLSAMTAVAGGLTKRSALRALTLDAARLLRIDSDVGSLEKGKEADLVVFSHDPLDPRARVLLVVQDGQIVHSMSQTKEVR